MRADQIARITNDFKMHVIMAKMHQGGYARMHQFQLITCRYRCEWQWQRKSLISTSILDNDQKLNGNTESTILWHLYKLWLDFQRQWLYRLSTSFFQWQEYTTWHSLHDNVCSWYCSTWLVPLGWHPQASLLRM